MNRLRNRKLRQTTFKDEPTIETVVERLRAELGLNFVLKLDGEPAPMPALSIAGVSAEVALKRACAYAAYKYEIRDNVIVVLSDGENWAWRQAPAAPAAVALQNRRVPELTLLPSTSLADVVEVLRKAPPTGGGTTRIDWVVKSDVGKMPHLHAPVCLREVSAWNALEVACALSGMGFTVENSVVTLLPSPSPSPTPPNPQTPKPSRFSERQAKMLRDSNGWNAMRKAASALFDGWRICNGLKNSIKYADFNGNARALGFMSAYHGHADVLRTAGLGDVLETDSVVRIRPGDVLSFYVCAPHGTRITVHDDVLASSVRKSRNVATYEVAGLSWQKVTMGLDAFAGKSMRLKISVWMSSFSSEDDFTTCWADLKVESRGR